MTRSSCPIWNTPATDKPIAADGRWVNSPRTGGEYRISGTAIAMLNEAEPWVKASLTAWLITRRKQGASCPEIVGSNVKEAAKWESLEIFERCDNILEYLAVCTPKLGSSVYFLPYINLYNDTVPNEFEVRYLELLAHASCVDKDELHFLLKHLDNQGLIEGYNPNNGEQNLLLSIRGHTRLAELKKTNPESYRAFVAMWFDLLSRFIPAWARM